MPMVIVNKTPRVLTRRCGLCLKMGAASLLLLLLLGYVGSTRAFQSDPDQSSILAAYNAAIYDAAVYKSSSVRPLKPLEFDSTKAVSVVTLTNSKYELGKTRLSGEVWVTAVPEVRNVCRGFSNDLEQRLRQLLGLHPSEKFTNFAVMRVKEKEIFRPTANPDPTTTLPCSSPPRQIPARRRHAQTNLPVQSRLVSQPPLLVAFRPPRLALKIPARMSNHRTTAARTGITGFDQLGREANR